MTKLYEDARKLRLPGIRVTAAIHPQDISPRLNRMAQKMVYAGVITGGWSSQSKRLARAVIESADPGVPCISRHGAYGFTVYNSATFTNYAPFDELIEANYLMEVLRGLSAKYERDHAETFKRRLRTAGVNGEYIPIGNSDNGLGDTFVELYTNAYTELTKARHAALASLLDGTRPIPISI